MEQQEQDFQSEPEGIWKCYRPDRECPSQLLQHMWKWVINPLYKYIPVNYYSFGPPPIQIEKTRLSDPAA